MYNFMNDDQIFKLKQRKAKTKAKSIKTCCKTYKAKTKAKKIRLKVKKLKQRTKVKILSQSKDAQ